jgi:hypothetical protein
MSSPQHKHSKEPLLSSVAGFIGNTLGTIASKASEIPEVVSHSELVRTARREGLAIPPQRMSGPENWGKLRREECMA